ncbi:hypothetical protein B9Z55_018781 [Caenorhabditis nigoni]|uniref:DUF19 domain-containing protein n=1 Tax=Caenorhabditis nigoni TaxID=1611254 RepID=A0A2G5TFM2_9PELO|nr:hypothetical protein B9Z55_018781 [Caenorhabditis nigoni]
MRKTGVFICVGLAPFGEYAVARRLWCLRTLRSCAFGCSVIYLTNCLSPDSLDTVVTKLVPPITNYTATLVKKVKTTLSDCKKTNTQTADAKQETCLQKTYGVAKAAITLTYVDNTCKKTVNQHVSSAWWTCGKKYIPSVLKMDKYNCSKIVKA